MRRYVPAVRPGLEMRGLKRCGEGTVPDHELGRGSKGRGVRGRRSSRAREGCMKSFTCLLQRMLRRLGEAPIAAWFVALFAGLTVCFLAMVPLPRVDNHLLGSDGGYYYAYMRSFWLDHDVSIGNDVDLYNSRMGSDNPNRLRVLYDRSIGPGVLWSPFFLVARGFTLLLSAAGVPIATDGFSYLEEAAVCIGSIFYAVLGLYALSVTLSRYVPARTAAASVFLMLGSTFALYYVVIEPSMGHALELFTVSAFVWSILGRESDTARAWAVAGMLGGLMVLVRWQNGVFLMLVPYGVMRAGKPCSRMVVGAVVAGIAFLATSAIQGIFWRVVFGKFVTIPQGGSFITPFETHFLDVLFSTRHGLISWHPVFAVAAVGMFLVRPRGMAATLSLLVVLQLYVCSIVSEWWCADAFGMRRMTGTIPFLTFGTAFLLDRVTASGPRRRVVAGCIGIVLTIWNLLFMAQYRLGAIPPGDALTLRQMTTGKLEVFAKGYEYFRRVVRPGR